MSNPTPQQHPTYETRDAQLQRLEAEVGRLRDLLRAERAQVEVEMRLGAKEIASREEKSRLVRDRAAVVRERNAQLKQQQRRQARRIADLEAELDLYRHSRAIRAVTRIVRRLRRAGASG